MDSIEIRKRFLSFFASRGYMNIPSASLVPEGDASTLFVNSGMQPLVPYLLGQKHPKGTLLANVQKSWRTGDIEEVGDNTHLTFFEMLGRWDMGEFSKEAIITSTFEFLTSKEEGLGLEPSRLYASIFEGNDDAPRDEESAGVWKSLGVPYYFRNAEENWWSSGDSGPCGPDSEVFYDVTDDGLGELSPEAFQKADDSQEVIELWNDVFMEYNKKDGSVVGKLEQRNVDTGVGLERVVAVVQGKANVFETDLFESIISKIQELSTKSDEKLERIVADHVRSAVFAIADGVEPSNTDRGYTLRRLIRRAVRSIDLLGVGRNALREIAEIVISKYGDVEEYKNIAINKDKILLVFIDEENKFRKTLTTGHKKLIGLATGSGGQKVTGDVLFDVFQSYGYPFEMSIDELNNVIFPELGYPKLSEKQTNELRDVFDAEFEKHQNISRTAASGKFKGGLADHGEKTVRLHTAHHLLLSALQKVLGEDVKQRGSNITPERLRIDFSFDRKLTDEEKHEIENMVNEWINQDLSVVRRKMALEDAIKIGAEMEFGQKYPDMVSVYFIEDSRGNVISKEFCGGPHIEKTSELGIFKIGKEKASSAGVRRIKATLQ